MKLIALVAAAIIAGAVVGVLSLYYALRAAVGRGLNW